MSVNTGQLKKWCMKNINAMAWQRLGLELFDELAALGIDFDELDDPSNEAELSDEAFDLIKNKISEIYQVEVEESVLDF